MAGIGFGSRSRLDRLKTILTVLMAVLSVMGIVTFALFITEEAFQTAMFGTWPAQDAKDWAQVKQGLTVMEKAVWTMNAINYSVGWIQPLAFVSYRAYGKSADYYIESLRSKVLAHAPELFIGEKITLRFAPNTIRKRSDGRLEAVNGKMYALVAAWPERGFIELTGVLKVDSDGRLSVHVVPH